MRGNMHSGSREPFNMRRDDGRLRNGGGVPDGSQNYSRDRPRTSYSSQSRTNTTGTNRFSTDDSRNYYQNRDRAADTESGQYNGKFSRPPPAQNGSTGNSGSSYNGQSSSYSQNRSQSSYSNGYENSSSGPTSKISTVSSGPPPPSASSYYDYMPPVSNIFSYPPPPLPVKN